MSTSRRRRWGVAGLAAAVVLAWLNGLVIWWLTTRLELFGATSPSAGDLRTSAGACGVTALLLLVGLLTLLARRAPWWLLVVTAVGVGTQLALARVYQSREPKETLKWLWSSDLRTNTLHVEDGVRAMWAAAEWRAINDRIPNAANERIVFNVVDKGATTQGMMAAIIRQIFGIETGFQNAIVNTFAKLNLEHVVDDVNDDTLDDWADLQEASGIKDNGGPLSPFMEKELLRDADLSLDGSRFETVLGFR